MPMLRFFVEIQRCTGRRGDSNRSSGNISKLGKPGLEIVAHKFRPEDQCDERHRWDYEQLD